MEGKGLLLRTAVVEADMRSILVSLVNCRVRGLGREANVQVQVMPVSPVET